MVERAAATVVATSEADATEGGSAEAMAAVRAAACLAAAGSAAETEAGMAEEATAAGGVGATVEEGTAGLEGSPSVRVHGSNGGPSRTVTSRGCLPAPGSHT